MTDRVIAGVCGGIAEHLQVDSTLVRVMFVIGTVLTGGLGLLGYIVLLILMPLPGRPAPFTSDAGATTTTVEGAFAPPRTPPAPDDPATVERRRETFGYFLIVLGALFFAANWGAFRIVRLDFMWPLVLIALGVLLLAQRARR
jgi:phage shock protein C